MSKFIASVGVYCYEKDRVIVEAFIMQEDDWKKALLLHSEFQEELTKGTNLDWLSHDLDTARRELACPGSGRAGNCRRCRATRIL